MPKDKTDRSLGKDDIDIGKAGGISSDFNDTYDIGYDEYEEKYQDFIEKKGRKTKKY